MITEVEEGKGALPFIGVIPIWHECKRVITCNRRIFGFL